MIRLAFLASPPLPIPSILFFLGLALWVVVSLVIRNWPATRDGDPLGLAGLGQAQRAKIRGSISRRELPTDADQRKLAIEWATYEVASGRTEFVAGSLLTVAPILALCVVYDFPKVPALLVVVATVQGISLFVWIVGCLIRVRRWPQCKELALHGEFAASPSTG